MNTKLIGAVFALAIAAHASQAAAHGVPALVTELEGRLAIQGLLPIGEFQDDGFEIYAEDPGFGVTFATSGPPAGTEIRLRSVGGLLYWDGLAVTDATASLTIEAPEFDSLGQPNSAGVDEYALAAGSPPLSGMTWAIYPGANFWDAHGYFTLSPGAPAGVYGAPLVLDSPTLGASDPFLLTFIFQNGAAWDPAEGITALQIAFAAPAPGDFNGDGSVDEDDHSFWAAQYGAPVVPGAGADANGDGLVNAADYTAWRDALPGAARAVPEPGTMLLLLFAFSAGFRSRQ